MAVEAIALHTVEAQAVPRWEHMVVVAVIPLGNHQQGILPVAAAQGRERPMVPLLPLPENHLLRLLLPTMATLRNQPTNLSPNLLDPAATSSSRVPKNSSSVTVS